MLKFKLKKLAFIAPASIIHTLKWVNAIADAKVDGHEFSVTLITQHKISGKINKKVNVIYLPYEGSKGYVFNAFALHRIINQLAPDVVNVHYASGYGTLALLANIKPYILSVWGSDVYEFPFQSKFKLWLIKKNLLNAEQIASTSHAMANQVKLILGQPNLGISITPFGVDLTRFKKTISPFDSKAITIGLVKKLEYKYGIDLLIKAFALVIKEYPQMQLKLVLVGDGALEEELKQLAVEQGVISQVDFVGLVTNEQVVNYINKIDVFVVPSRIESFGVAAIEALGCERPCIVSNTGGLPEVILDGETGLVVKQESEQALAKAIITLLENTELAIELGKKGRINVLSRYSQDAALKIMLNLYQDFLVNYERL